jgi:uncharacterized RDD family membrane protein YckC
MQQIENNQHAPKQHAYEPSRSPELFEGVIMRRLFAFFVDRLIVMTLTLMLVVIIGLLGVFTFGLAWGLFVIIPSFYILAELIYVGWTIGSKQSATLGMRFFEIEMRTWYGASAYMLLGIFHFIVFAFITSLGIFSLLGIVGLIVVPLLDSRRRTLQDILCGVVIINNAKRAAILKH